MAVERGRNAHWEAWRDNEYSNGRTRRTIIAYDGTTPMRAIVKLTCVTLTWKAIPGREKTSFGRSVELSGKSMERGDAAKRSLYFDHDKEDERGYVDLAIVPPRSIYRRQPWSLCYINLVLVAFEMGNWYANKGEYSFEYKTYNDHQWVSVFKVPKSVIPNVLVRYRTIGRSFGDYRSWHVRSRRTWFQATIWSIEANVGRGTVYLEYFR